ncbi:hypothetical protein EI94DRAFT_1780769 [Lactarius quietus]|nr:hypothetical protein EI94DRAFT_1780769 [Lactarius quietus]
MTSVETEKQHKVDKQSSVAADGGNEHYNLKYAQYKPTLPDVFWEPLKEVKVFDRGLAADPEKKSLLFKNTTKLAASKVITLRLTPARGTELHGIDLRRLSDEQKDELSLLVAERGAVCKLYMLHTAITPIPQEPGLEEVHVVYSDSSHHADPTSFSKRWHTDVSFELQPPSTTSLKMLTGPESGGDTLWSSGYSLYSSLSPGLQTYLEILSAVHSAVDVAQSARAMGSPVRRELIETAHPVVRVHPATGWKSVYVSPGWTQRIIGVPEAESDAILAFLYAQIAENYDFQMRYKWEPNDVVIWDNRVVTHSATYDSWPSTRHALRVTPHGERPISVADYERATACVRLVSVRATGKRARDCQLDLLERRGIQPPERKDPSMRLIA